MVDKKRVFIDASVFIAAAGSKSGGSFLVLEVCKGIYYNAFATRRILTEAQTNIRKKMPSEILIAFYKIIAALNPIIVETPEDLNPYNDLISLKDRHVLASAIDCGATFLITLDRRHFQTEVIKNANLDLNIMTPKEFLDFAKKEIS